MKKLLLALLVLFLIYLLLGRMSKPPEPAITSDRGTRLSQLLSSNSNAEFAKAIEARTFRFPEDHGPHPAFRNEWWYVTGNLDSDSGRRFGFELTFFRFALDNRTPESHSAWGTNQVYIAHFAVTDEQNNKFYVEQKYARGALGLAGAQSEPFKVWIDDWYINTDQNNKNNWKLKANGSDFSLDLDLFALKEPVLNGINGLSQKSDRPGNASYYYSITRIQSSGNIKVGGESHRVSGFAWLDREWSSSALSVDQEGWDWFALQLNDGSELMFYHLRRNNGEPDHHSAGTWVSTDGLSRRLEHDDVKLLVIDEWESPGGALYPAKWEIQIPVLNLDLVVTPIMANQELVTTVRYWEGAVDVLGRRDDEVIEGRGYVELTGYAK